MATTCAVEDGVTPDSNGQLPDDVTATVKKLELDEAQQHLSDDDDEGQNGTTATADVSKPKKKKKKKKKPAGDSAASQVEPVEDDKEEQSGACAVVSTVNPVDTQSQKRKKKKKALAKATGAQAMPKTDILLLYDGTYKEPTDIKPVKPQTYPPSFPVCELYPNGEFPKGLEMPYGSDVAAQQRVTSKEKRALERAQADLYNDIRQAAEAHRHVRKYMQTVIKPGRTMIDICTELENYSRLMINEKGLSAGKQIVNVYDTFTCSKTTHLL